MPSKTINGVRHAKRCACPICDPDQRLAQRVREEARAARRAWSLAARVLPLPLAADRPRRVLLAPFETEKTRRLRELLREGKTAAQAIEIIQSELLEVSHEKS
jgi:hypothetical protein